MKTRAPIDLRTAFAARPHRTLAAASVPVFFSLVAEPITGLVDTAFVKELGTAEAAALGVGTIVLSSTFWVFNFLGVGIHTEVAARAVGAGRRAEAASAVGLALSLALVFGLLSAAVLALAARPIAASMGAAEGPVLRGAVTYLQIRALASPLVIGTAVCLGALRGLHDMKAPMRVALLANAVNIAIDPVLIFGLGPVPALGIAGAAWASVAAQCIAALVALRSLARRLDLRGTFGLAGARSLLVIGGDMFVRTGALTLFLLAATRAATSAGDAAGAAHLAIRNVWLFAALVLDANAAVVQSLVASGPGDSGAHPGRGIAAVATTQALVIGAVLGGTMLLSTDAAAALLVPPAAHACFAPAWLIAAAAMPFNAVAFSTDGYHQGRAQYRYLRNGMLLASTLGIAALAWFAPADADATTSLTTIWTVTAAWITVRALWGHEPLWRRGGAR